jgi:D-proline reductase (dithiol) PrdB
MSYLFSEHQRALAPLMFPDAEVGSEAFRRATVLPRFDAPPMVPVHKQVSQSTIGLLVSLGARVSGQEPFQRTNDLSYRLIPRGVPSAQIVFEHATPARFWADEDLNVAFPRDRMAELEAEGTIGALAPDAVSILGSITRWDQLATAMAPRSRDEFTRQNVDLVLVVPFCPQCHQATAVLARALEARGLPTVLLSTLRDISEAYQPPRTALVDYPIGSPCGRVGDLGHQRATLRAALTCPLDTTTTQLHTVDLPYQADGGRDWIETTLAAYRANTANGQENIRRHGHYESLAGQEKEFTVDGEKVEERPVGHGGLEPALGEERSAEPRFGDFVPVSLGIVVLLVGVILIDRVAALRGARQLDVAPEEARQDGVGIRCVAQHRLAVREVDPHRRELVAGARRLNKRRSAPEQAAPQLRVLRARDLARLAVADRVAAIAGHPAVTHLDHVELLAQHRLDGEPPQRPNCAHRFTRIHLSALLGSVFAYRTRPMRRTWGR